MLKAVLFDLDGTLLPMDGDQFIDRYFTLLSDEMSKHGYDRKAFMDAILKALAAETVNDGSRTNEEVFWDVFTSVFGEGSRKDNVHFDLFYRNEFQTVKGVCDPSPKAKEIVDLLNGRGVKVILATNPFFPKVATESRIRWAGLKPEDFILWTTFEDIGYSKPNPEYYLEIMRMTGLDPKDCMMVGNDVDEDIIAAESAGMRTFLVDTNMINRNGRDIGRYRKGDLGDLLIFLRGELSDRP